MVRFVHVTCAPHPHGMPNIARHSTRYPLKKYCAEVDFYLVYVNK